MNNNTLPTFLLRGINTTKIIEDYLANKYATSELPAKIKVVKNELKVSEQYSHNLDNATYTYGNRSNRDQVVTTVNHEKYIQCKIDHENGIITECPSAGGICNWCRQAFENTPCGIPINIQSVRVSDDQSYNMIIDESNIPVINVEWNVHILDTKEKILDLDVIEIVYILILNKC